jgi:tetratricopeptide (TPR) repeat protein
MKNVFKISQFGLLWMLGSLAVSPALAQEDTSSPYALSGPCASQGAWTQAALSRTSELKQIITKLKDNPACNSLKSSIESSLTAMEKNLGEIQQIDKSSDSKSRRLLQLPQEIGALRTFSRESSMFKNNVMQLLMGKTVTLSALSSQNAVQSTSDSLQTLGYRAQAAAGTGLQLFNSTMSAMQQAQAGCLDDTQGVAMTAGMIKILSSFASSGNNGLNSQLATAVQNLGQYLSREKKYVKALRMLNDREFTTSMSCLMEITTDGYCSALDAQYLFQEVMNSQSIEVKDFTNKKTGKVEKKVVGLSQNFSKKLEEGPLAGYYILSKQMPVVTNWIQKVQYGITPQLPTEADFQINVSTNVYQHYNRLKRIEGTFNSQRKLMQDLADFKTKQTYVLQMLNNVASNMTDSGMRDGGSENFFTKSASTNEIYFRLLGMSTIPDAVLGTGPEGMQFVNNPQGWLNAKYRTLPIFNDPNKLADMISDNMQGLFKEATTMAIAYYNKFFIVDKTQVVNDSLLGLDVNVRDALVNIDKYLKALRTRIQTDSNDPTIIASIDDTRARIGRILGRYKELRDYSAQLVEKSKAQAKEQTAQGKPVEDYVDPDLNAKLRKIGEDLLQQVYTELEVLTARTGFLSNRMSGFVYQDYTISLRHRDQFNQYYEDLMLATGYNTLNTMMNMSQTEYSKVKTDLDQAMNIYKKNIDSMEEIVASVFVRNIFDLRLSATNDELTEVQRTEMAYEFAKRMGSTQIPGEDSWGWVRTLRGYGKRVWMDLTFEDREQLGAPGMWDKLAMPFRKLGNAILQEKGKIVVSPVSEFSTAQGEMAKLCTQTLAFANLRTYWELCKDVQLDSPLMKKNVTDPDLKKMLNTYLSVNYLAKAYENVEVGKKNITGLDRARNYQARICALRDYHRRNEIARMTSGMISDGDTYENVFTKSVEVPVDVK